MSEHDARLERPIGARNDRFPRQHHKSRHITGVILDSVSQDIETVEFRSSGAGDCGSIAEVIDGNELSSTSSIVNSLAGDVEAEFGKSVLALS